MDWEKYIGFQAGITNNNFKVSASFTGRSKGIPTGAYNPDLTGNVKTIDVRSYVETSYRKELKKNSPLLFRSYFDDYHYNGSYPQVRHGMII